MHGYDLHSGPPQLPPPGMLGGPMNDGGGGGGGAGADGGGSSNVGDGVELSVEHVTLSELLTGLVAHPFRRLAA